MAYKNFISFLLLISLISNAGVFATDVALEVPVSNRIKYDGYTLQIYPKDKSLKDIIGGSALMVAAVLPFMVCRNTTELDEQLCTFCSAMFCFSGFFVLVRGCYKRFKDRKPLITISELGIASSDKLILWNDLADIQNGVVYLTKQTVTGYFVKTETFTEKQIVFVASSTSKDFSFHDKIAISVDLLPISPTEIVRLVEAYKALYALSK